MFLPFIFLLFGCTALEGHPAGQAVVAAPFEIRQWVETNFAVNKIPPFSFNFAGRNSKTFLTKWKYQAERRESSNFSTNEIVYTYSAPNNRLAVKCFVTWYDDFPAVEWVLKFSNPSSRNSPLLDTVNAVHHLFSHDKSGPFILHHANGCNTLRNDFQPFDRELKIGNSVYMTPDGGRSSGGPMAFPFFNIENPGGDGVMVAIGWTGKWYAEVRQEDEQSASLKAGMEKMRLYLLPQEEIRTPRICLLFWKGNDRMAGHNQFRRFVLAHHTRKIDGKPNPLPLAAFLGRGGPAPCNEFACTTESPAIAWIFRHRQFNILPEVFWLDAGWYACQGDWHNTGSWCANRDNFPNGLKPVSDAVHQAGAKFLVWFEPERVRDGTELAIEHPHWLIERPNVVNKLLNLGNKEAVHWLIDRVSTLIEKEGIDIYRQDFNMDPLPYWQQADAPQRTGIAEIRHIEGLYAFWDALLARFPGLIIDNCASGGRRIDLETISRSSPFWRTDFHGYDYPNGCQDNTYALNFYLPLHGTANMVRSQYFFRSNLSSSLVLDWEINSKDCSQAEMQEYIHDFKRLRPFYSGDFYPLTGKNSLLKDNTWLAYQLNRPEQGDGIVLAFRREGNRDESIRIQLGGMEENAGYTVFYEDYGLKENKTGSELLSGIDIYIPTNPGSLLISYQKNKQPARGAQMGG